MRSKPLEKLKDALETAPELYQEIVDLVDELNQEIIDLEVEIDLMSGNRKRPRKKFDDEV